MIRNERQPECAQKKLVFGCCDTSESNKQFKILIAKTETLQESGKWEVRKEQGDVLFAFVCDLHISLWSN